MRIAVSLGGDSDTQACIGGSIAQAHDPRIPADLETHVASGCRRICSTSMTVSVIGSCGLDPGYVSVDIEGE